MPRHPFNKLSDKNVRLAHMTGRALKLSSKPIDLWMPNLSSTINPLLIELQREPQALRVTMGEITNTIPLDTELEWNQMLQLWPNIGEQPELIQDLLNIILKELQ